MEEELPALIALAELHAAHARQKLQVPEVVRLRTPRSTPPNSDEFGYEELAEARRCLDDVWDRAARGPYPLFHADAFNELAALERLTLQVIDTELATNPNPERRQHLLAERPQTLARAQQAAVQAYEYAWLEGPPYAYAPGLTRATEHLQALGVALPTSFNRVANGPR